MVGLKFVDSTSKQEFSCNEEVLMDIMNEVLEIGIDTCLGIDGGNFAGKQMIVLNNTHGYCLKLLCMNHLLSELDVSKKLPENHEVKIA